MAQQEISPFDLTAQHDAKTEKDDATRLEAQLEVDDLKFIMGHKQGRRFVQRLLDSYGLFRTSFSTEPLLMAAREGVRNEGLKLFASIHEHCPERYAEMMKEHAHGRRRRNVAGDSSTGSNR